MKRLTLLVLLSTSLLLLYSCSDVLNDAQPTTSISEEQTLGNPGGIDAFRAGMYDRLHAFDYQTSYMLGASALADGLASRDGTTRFSGYVENSRGTGLSTYGLAYDLINDANIMIGAIPEGVIDPAVKQQYIGEAYFLRAFAMHHLVRALGYEPGMTPATGPGAGFDLGIEIRTEPTQTASDADFRPRKTVEQVYEQIEADLLDSISILSNGDSGNVHYVTQAAAEALLARVYLYWQKYDEAESYASDAIANSSASLATPAQVATMFDETAGINPEGIFVTAVDPSAESLGYNSSLSSYTAQAWSAMIPTQDLLDLYESGDARLALYGPCFNEVTDQPVPNCIATHPDIVDGGGNPVTLEVQKWNAEPGQFADDVPLLRIAEMYLIQAEARLNGAPGDPLTPLNALKVNRNATPYVGTDILEEILDERRREFFAEGQRFWDLKRLGREIRKAPETLSPIVQPVPYNDYRILDNYPNGEVALSEAQAPADSVLIQNPGY